MRAPPDIRVPRSWTGQRIFLRIESATHVVEVSPRSVG